MKRGRRIHHYSGGTEIREDKSRNATVTIMARPTTILSKPKGYLFAIEWYIYDSVD